MRELERPGLLRLLRLSRVDVEILQVCRRVSLYWSQTEVWLLPGEMGGIETTGCDSPNTLCPDLARVLWAKILCKNVKKEVKLTGIGNIMIFLLENWLL